jgi:hypothetical protein
MSVYVFVRVWMFVYVCMLCVYACTCVFISRSFLRSISQSIVAATRMFFLSVC